MNKFRSAVSASQHNFKPYHITIIEQALLADGYDLSNCFLLGDGGEGTAIAVTDPEGVERALRICYFLSHSWEPDWGHRSYDANIFSVQGQEVHQLDDGSFWYIQELCELVERADDWPEILWQEFEYSVHRDASNLYHDETWLLGQVGLVEREDGLHIVLFDYGAFSATDMNASFTSFSNYEEGYNPQDYQDPDCEGSCEAYCAHLLDPYSAFEQEPLY